MSRQSHDASTEEWENELTAKQRAFVREYLIDLNATQAAIRAGYSAKTAASQGERLLRNVEVQRAISAAMKIRADRTDITADRVIKELAKIGFADIRKAIKWQGTLVTEEDNPDGGDTLVIKNVVTNNVMLISSDDIDDETAGAISEISQNSNGGIKLKLHDKRAALVDLGKHLGIFTEKVEVTGKDGGPIKTESTSDRDLAKAVALLLAKGMNANG
jgi:phage terminase small subunit